MNPTVDNDLQKAIDDITKNTNTDPVFADPVAAPAPELNMAPAGPAAPISDFRPGPAPRPMPRPVAPRPAAPAPMPMPPVSAPAPAPEPIAAPAPLPPAPELVSEESYASETITTTNPDMQSVKEAALRDLAPLLGKIDMDSSKKFNLYKNIREELHDDSIIGDAYSAARNISDDTERGEALLYLVESIDNM